ncbi:hypothetical protein [Nostoc sp.]|uniref:hypothetical protein n=1 Tax=Nostoc sp. TaxID=1180 RepID=UPI002FF9A809
MLNNQSYLKDLGLVEELDQEAAETISGGGYEVFEVRNKTGYNVSYTVDGTRTNYPQPGSDRIWTAYGGGIIEFDTDGRNDYKQIQKYNLANGGVYEFQDNKTTVGNPYDIELYRVA